MSFKFGIGLIGLCEDYCGSRNPKNRDDALLKLAWAVDKEFDKIGVIGRGLLAYDCKST
jgi:hypothetical protein